MNSIKIDPEMMQTVELLDKDIKAPITKHYIRKGRTKHSTLMKGIEDTPLQMTKNNPFWQ